MLTAPKYLNIVSKRGQQGKPLERVYRLIRQPEVLQMAYMNLYANPGATTVGTDPQDTVDGMSLKRIQDLAEELASGTFQWKPVRRVYIKKANGQLRPLGIPGWKDKMVQEAMRLSLNAYYEPQFSTLSHGFRSERSCHTALNQVDKTWTGTKWFIEGDIKGCFDNIDHEKLMAILARNIRDDRFLKLVRQMLSAGYMEDWRYHQTYSGTPQGGVISPLLANIYLHELDSFVEHELIPAFTVGDKRRKRNPAYRKIQWQWEKARTEGDRKRARLLNVQRKKLPYYDPQDPAYRRLRFIRYADDFLLGYIGPKHEAEEIKQRLANFLREHLKLELSDEKTLVTHATTEAARFLGYEVRVVADSGNRKLDGHIMLRMPRDVRTKWKAKYLIKGKTAPRLGLVNHNEYDIIMAYRAAFDGIVNYYALAINVGKLNDLKYVMKQSLVKTLAQKLKIRAKQVYRKFGAARDGYKVIEVTIPREGKKSLIATFGNKPCRWTKQPLPVQDAEVRHHTRRTELLKRLVADGCELCGKPGEVEVHHVRKLSDLARKWQGRTKPEWVKRMIEIRRKTLVVCRECHQAIHDGSYDGTKLTTE
jgi:group II intron reverse transcriptase/maturase